MRVLSGFRNPQAFWYNALYSPVWHLIRTDKPRCGFVYASPSRTSSPGKEYLGRCTGICCGSQTVSRDTETFWRLTHVLRKSNISSLWRIGTVEVMRSMVQSSGPGGTDCSPFNTWIAVGESQPNCCSCAWYTSVGRHVQRNMALEWKTNSTTSLLINLA